MADLGGLIDQLSGSSSGLAPPIVGQEQQLPAPISKLDPVINQLLGASVEHAKPEMPSPTSLEAPPTNVSAGPRGFLDALAAGAQGTSPITTNAAGAPNYQLAPPEEQWAYKELGVPRDQQKYIELGGQVYNRNPAMAEGPLPALGRVLSLAQPETGIPAVGARAIPSASQNLLQDFSSLGVTPNVPAVGQGRLAGLTSQILKNIPFASGPATKAVGQTISDTSNAAERIAGNYGVAANPEEGGTALRSGLTNFAKAKFPAAADALYSEFDRMMPSGAQIPIDNTIAAIGAPTARFPSNPQLGQVITNKALQQLSGALTPGSTLTFPELQEFRSSIGRAIGDPTLVNDIPRADLKRVYGGISQDLEAAATAQKQANANVALPAGMQPNDPLAAFQKANSFYKQGMDRIDAIEPFLNGSPEQSFAKLNAAAGTTGGANAGGLRQLQSVMEPADWNNVASAVIRKMGEPTPGAKDVLATPFSASSFSTNWNKLSDAAKDTLFGPVALGSNRSDLETLARVSQAQKNVQKLANTSHSAEYGTLAFGGLEAGRELFSSPDQMLEHLAMGVGGGIGANLTSRALMSPGFAKWLYQMPNAYATAPSTAVGAQRVMGGLENVIRSNPSLAPLRGALVARQGAQ